MSQKLGSKLMTPLFVDGKFNQSGKRIRAKYVKTVRYGDTEYPLWISAGKPENNYPQSDNDTHYLMIQANGYLVPCRYTQYDLENRSGMMKLIQTWYDNSPEKRNKMFHDLREEKSISEYDSAVKDIIAKEDEFIHEWGKKDEIQSEYLKRHFVDPSIASYVEARDQNGRYACFQGAAFLGETEKCWEIRLKIVEQNKKEQEKKEEQKRKEAEEMRILEQKRLQEEIENTEKVFLSGGVISNPTMIIEIADKYEIDIPIRTRGWILNKLQRCTIYQNGKISYSYSKSSKNSKGSDKAFEVMFSILDVIKTVSGTSIEQGA